MNTKKLSPGKTAGIVFLLMILCNIFFIAFLLLLGPVLPLPGFLVDFSTSITNNMLYIAIGAAAIAYFWAKSKQKN